MEGVMTQAAAKIRLYLDPDGPGAQLAAGIEAALGRDQSNYLVNVMRLGVGARLRVFNGRDGEWLAEIASANKRAAVLRLLSPTAAQTEGPDLWLCFAPLKKARTDFVAEKACEMGCHRLVPVLTRYTNAERVRTDRLRAHAIEAAEQCGIVSVPMVSEPVGLAALLDRWPPERRLMFCDESGQGLEAVRALSVEAAGPWAVLIGPEGGFAPEEAARLRAHPGAVAVTLGPRILRADTAAVAALALWQSALGDWR